MADCALFRIDRTWLIFLIYLIKVINLNAHECKNINKANDYVKLAERSLLKMNSEVEPCTDFYEFACGKYPENTLLTESEKRNSVSLMDNYSKMYEFLAEMIENFTNVNTDSIASKRKAIYKSCVEFNDWEKELAMMKHKMSDYFIPNWPNINEFNNTYEDMITWLSRLFLSGEFAFFAMNIWTNDTNKYENYFKNRGMTLPPETSKIAVEIRMRISDSTMADNCASYSKDKFKHFLHKITDTLDFSRTAQELFIEDTFKVDEKLQIFLANANFNSSQNSTYDFNCSGNSSSNMWCRLLHMIINATDTTSELLIEDTKFLHPEEFLIIDDLLNSFPKRVIANYLASRVFIHNLGELDKLSLFVNYPCNRKSHDMADVKFERKELNCAHFVVSHVPMLIVPEFIYSEKMFERINSVKGLLDELLHSLKNTVNISWASDEAKKNFDVSFNRTSLSEIDYMQYIYSIDVSSRYSNLQIYSNSIYLNIESMARIKTINRLTNYNEGFLYNAFQESNPFYINAAAGIDIDIGFGFFKIPYSNVSLPSFTNYGKLGFVLAHEVVHNLQGALSLNIENADTAFKKCVKDKYSKFKVPTLNIHNNATMTFTENMADILGLQIAYNAFKLSGDSNNSNQVYPRLLNYTNTQLFFIFTAQGWCEFGNNYNKYRTNMHSPSHHRIIGSVANTDSFSEAFHCKEGSPMNPFDKCAF